jgi:hypothetical protein
MSGGPSETGMPNPWAGAESSDGQPAPSFDGLYGGYPPQPEAFSEIDARREAGDWGATGHAVPHGASYPQQPGRDAHGPGHAWQAPHGDAAAGSAAAGWPVVRPPFWGQPDAGMVSRLLQGGAQ